MRERDEGLCLLCLAYFNSWWWGPVELVGSRRPVGGRVGNPQGCPSGHPQVSAFSAQSGSPRQRACPQIHRACAYRGVLVVPLGSMGVSSVTAELLALDGRIDLPLSARR